MSYLNSCLSTSHFTKLLTIHGLWSMQCLGWLYANVILSVWSTKSQRSLWTDDVIIMRCKSSFNLAPFPMQIAFEYNTLVIVFLRFVTGISWIRLPEIVCEYKYFGDFVSEICDRYIVNRLPQICPVANEIHRYKGNYLECYFMDYLERKSIRYVCGNFVCFIQSNSFTWTRITLRPRLTLK